MHALTFVQLSLTAGVVITAMLHLFTQQNNGSFHARLLVIVEVMAWLRRCKIRFAAVSSWQVFHVCLYTYPFGIVILTLEDLLSDGQLSDCID